VDAWDISEVGLAALSAELERRRATGQSLDVTPRRVDLDAAELPEQQYDLILDAFFLDRGLFRPMQAALRPGGLVVVHTLMRRRQHEDRNPAHLLEPGELATSFSGLRTLRSAEDNVAGWAELVARRDL
jgi:SAM-dependent methyltransferase